jgi:aspartate/methionine/tyrosine aminotransferase
MEDKKEMHDFVDVSPARFVRKGLDDGRYESISNERRRLNDVRDIFYEREVSEEENRISLAEGGCFHPTSLPVLQTFIDTALDIDSYPSQIYPQQNVLPAFVDKIWSYFAETCSIPLLQEKHGVVFGFGSSHIYDMFLSVVAEKNDIILMPESYYHAFSEWPAKWGAEARCIKTKKENAYKLTAEDLGVWCEENQQSINNVCSLVITNPTTTGAVYTKSEIEELATVIDKYDFLVFCDEVFRDTVFDEREMISFASIENLADRIITSNSGSKSKSVADLRIGWACGPKEIVDRMIWHMEHSFTEVPLYLQQIGVEILNISRTDLKSEIKSYEERVARITELIDYSNKRLLNSGVNEQTAIKVVYLPKSGHYFALDFSFFRGWRTPEGRVIQNSEDLCRYFYYHEHTDYEGQIGHGVCFSCGHSKGHDDIILYAAYAQPGYEYANEIAKPYNKYKLAKYMLSKIAATDIDDGMIEQALSSLGIERMEDEPDYTGASEAGMNILTDAFDRVVCALKLLTPPLSCV